MWWTELRGLIAVALVAGGIAYAWTEIEGRATVDEEVATVTTTTTTTTTAPPTTTLDNDARNLLICERARSFAEEAELVDPAAGPGPVARLALDFWREVNELASREVQAEMSAVVTYYEDYLETAAPFDFDPARIILEGDKEKLQQLLTRPAPGLAPSRALISFCGVTVPDQPSMRADDFDRLERRLLGIDEEDDGDS